MVFLALSDRIYKQILGELVSVVKKNPEADTTAYEKKVCAEVAKWEDAKAVNVIETFFLNLYNHDVDALKRDVTKVAVVGGKDASPQERANLLRCLVGSIGLFLQDDFSSIVAMCDDLSKTYQMDEDEITEEDTPFQV